MLQCAARQFENELVERLSILADRHLRPPAPEGGTVSRPGRPEPHAARQANIAPSLCSAHTAAIFDKVAPVF